MFVRALFRRRGMFGKIFEDRKRGDREDLLFLHQPHGFVAELIGVVDRDHAGLRGEERSRLSGGMNRHVFAEASRFFHRGFELRLGVLIGS